ncbi:hypothetical protein [Streptomyces sp. NPDC059742]
MRGRSTGFRSRCPRGRRSGCGVRTCWLLRATACAWFGIQTWIGARASPCARASFSAAAGRTPVPWPGSRAVAVVRSVLSAGDRRDRARHGDAAAVRELGARRS